MTILTVLTVSSAFVIMLFSAIFSTTAWLWIGGSGLALVVVLWVLRLAANIGYWIRDHYVQPIS